MLLIVHGLFLFFFKCLALRNYLFCDITLKVILAFGFSCRLGGGRAAKWRWRSWRRISNGRNEREWFAVVLLYPCGAPLSNTA